MYRPEAVTPMVIVSYYLISQECLRGSVDSGLVECNSFSS